jgi:hypothetical protein
MLLLELFESFELFSKIINKFFQEDWYGLLSVDNVLTDKWLGGYFLEEALQ